MRKSAFCTNMYAKSKGADQLCGNCTGSLSDSAFVLAYRLYNPTTLKCFLNLNVQFSIHLRTVVVQPDSFCVTPKTDFLMMQLIF